MTHSRPTIHELLDRHGLAARRELGQNFVADPNTVRRIAELSQVGPGDLVVEIGPGLGSLTLALVETGATVVAVEIDSGLAAVATEILDGAATVIESDALTLDWGRLIAEHGAQAGEAATGSSQRLEFTPTMRRTVLMALRSSSRATRSLAWVKLAWTTTTITRPETCRRPYLQSTLRWPTPMTCR